MKSVYGLIAVLCCSFQRAFVTGHQQFHSPSAAFALGRNRAASKQQQVQQKQASQKQSLEDLAVQQSTEQNTGKTVLKFQASTNYATEPRSTSTPESMQYLQDFLFQDEHRDMILAGADSQNKIQVLHHPDIELYRLWQIETRREPNLVAPSVGDAILRVTTHGIHFPGLTLKTVATVGCKQVMTEDTHPCLQITLIQDELQAEGPEPLVWVFHQLTGTGESSFFSPFSLLRGNNSQADQQRRTHSTNVITAECDKESLSIIFRSVAKLSIDVSFPSMLLRILPVSKEMAESQGSDAINKVVNRDIGPSLEALKNKYQQEYCENEQD